MGGALPAGWVNRLFKADRPIPHWVLDFTYVSTWQSWLRIACVIDVFARRIMGWRVSTTMITDCVFNALEQALYARQPAESDAPAHHSDRGAQYVSIRYTKHLVEAGIELSIGSSGDSYDNALVEAGIELSIGSSGDSYDNALAETINGLYTAEVVHRRGPWKSRESVELATLK